MWKKRKATLGCTGVVEKYIIFIDCISIQLPFRAKLSFWFFSKRIKGKLRFDYSLKNHTWLNIGGNAKIFFVPETLTELRDFLLNIKNENNNFFIIGAGSNLLISENIQDRIFIKLGNPVEQIIEAAKTYTFVVIGDTGRTGLKRFFMGSVAFKVMEFANNSVMIVR